VDDDTRTSEHIPQQTPAEQETWRKLDGWFRSALDHPMTVEYQKLALKCYQYREGDQWTEAERAEHKKRHQPDTVNNQVAVTVNQIVGDACQRQTRTVFRPRKTVAAETVETLSEYYRFVGQSCQLDDEEIQALDDGSVGGFGVFYHDVTFNDLLEPDLRIRAIQPLEVYPDPWARRYDWNEDAKFIFWARWFDIEEAIELHPRFGAFFRTLASGDAGTLSNLSAVDRALGNTYMDFDDKGYVRRVRLIEGWYTKAERHDVFVTEGPQGLVFVPTDTLTKKERKGLERDPRSRRVERVLKKMHASVFTAWLLLSDGESPHGHDLFPFVPYYYHRRQDGVPYSDIAIALPMQDAINFRESKALHLLNTHRATFEENAIIDKDELANELAKPDGLIPVRRLEGIRIDTNLELARSQYEMHTGAQQDFRSITGLNPDARGEQTEMRSGIGVQRKMDAKNAVLARPFKNFTRTRKLNARLALHMMAHYLTPGTAFSVTNGLDETKPFVFSKDHAAALRTITYDAVVDEVPDTATARQEAFRALPQALQVAAPFGPTMMQLMLDLSDIPNKAEWMKKIEAMGHAAGKPAPHISVSMKWEDLTAEERIAWAGVLQNEALAHAEIQKQQPTRVEADQQTEQLRAQSHQQTAQTHADAQRDAAEISAHASLHQETVRGRHARQMKLYELAFRDNGGAPTASSGTPPPSAERPA